MNGWLDFMSLYIVNYTVIDNVVTEVCFLMKTSNRAGIVVRPYSCHYCTCSTSSAMYCDNHYYSLYRTAVSYCFIVSNTQNPIKHQHYIQVLLSNALRLQETIEIVREYRDC